MRKNQGWAASKPKKRKYAKNQVTVAPRWEESRLASFEAQEKQEIY